MSATMIGREDTAVFGSDHREERRWIGKPWRRVELLTNRFWYKGEEVERTRDLSIHLGSRRLGVGVTLTLIRASVLDYSDETP